MRPLNTIFMLLLWEVESVETFHGICASLFELLMKNQITVEEHAEARRILLANRPSSLLSRWYWGIKGSKELHCNIFWWKEGEKFHRIRFLKHLARKYKNV